MFLILVAAVGSTAFAAGEVVYDNSALREMAYSELKTLGPHDRGGVSFDFAKLSAERFPAEKYPAVGRNLIENPWHGVYTNGENRVIKLPHDRGGRFRIAAMTKVRPVDVDVSMGNTAIMIRFGNRRNNGKGGFVETPKRGEYVWNGFMKRGNDWYVATKEFAVRPGETHALVMLKCDKARIEIKDVVFCEEVPQPEAADGEKTPTKKALAIKAEFCNYIGGTFQVSEGQVGELAFSMANPDEVDVRKGIFSLTLPPGIDFVDATFARKGSAKTERRADGSSVTTFLPSPRFKAENPEARWWNAGCVLVKASRGLGECGEGFLSFRLKDGERETAADSMKIRFSIVPRIVGVQPKTYGMGGWQLGAYAFESAASAEQLARFHQTCGQNWIIPSADTSYPYLKLWRDCGFRYITPQSGNWCRNGYELSAEEVPEEFRIQPVGEVQGRYERDFMIALCPLVITGTSDYVKNTVLRRIADNVKGVDGLWSNWEPFMFTGAGCGCRRCGKAFAKFLGRDWTSISADWPKCAFPGGAYAKWGVEFRSRCHADVVRTLDRVVRGVTGADSIGFLPGIHFGQMTSSWRTHHPMPEASPEHYAADIPWINLWGPYVAWHANTHYVRERGRHIAHFVSAQDLREQLAADYPPEKRPRILASPQGTCGDYFTQPELFEMNFDAYFFNRFAGCCPWVFPIGADARYWRAFANASVRAAKYEDAVFKGVAADDRVKLFTVPEFAAPVERLICHLEKWRKVPQLFSNAYDYEGIRYVAVFNCWQQGEAFVRLRTEGLAAGEYRIVSDDGVLWAKDLVSPAYTAEQLANGVMLSVGSCRTRVFEIAPVGRESLTAAKSVMTLRRTINTYRERREALAAAAAQDAKDAEDDIAGITRYD